MASISLVKGYKAISKALRSLYPHIDKILNSREPLDVNKSNWKENVKQSFRLRSVFLSTQQKANGQKW